MALSLYDATVPSFRQTLGAVSGLLDKAEAHCADKGVSPDACIGARLFEDMLPLSFQVSQTVAHSAGALEAVETGVFSPHMAPPPDSFSGLKEMVANGLVRLGRFTSGDVNALQGRDMRFEFKERVLPFIAEDFLLSFSLPNFYFHATTAYDILRHNGVAIGKRDFMGQLRLRQ
jgi:uncharacterized protein